MVRTARSDPGQGLSDGLSRDQSKVTSSLSQFVDSGVDVIHDRRDRGQSLGGGPGENGVHARAPTQLICISIRVHPFLGQQLAATAWGR